MIVVLILSGCGTYCHVSRAEDLVAGKYLLIKNEIDLHGRTVKLAKGAIISFEGGTISNGTLVGDETIIRNAQNSFANVVFKGTWNVKYISSAFLANNDSLGLTNLLSLQNDKVKNTICIEKGDYFVSANEKRGALTLSSNTTLSIHGNIFLTPQTNENYYNGYYIIHIINANNVSVTGSGRIIGDNNKSLLSGEFGHGICIINSDNVTISGITIDSCKGDGIAVSKDNGKVIIQDVNINNFYRNGISIVGGDDVLVTNVYTSNGGKTSPMAAIDIEPNSGDSVGIVRICDFKTKDCKVGITGYVTENAHVESVQIKDVHIQNSIIPIDIKKNKNVYIEDVVVDKCNDIQYVIRAIGNDISVIHNMVFISPNCRAKYPFYIDNSNTIIYNSTFSCPQLFSFHLKNALFKNCIFEFDSFVWTALDILTKNIVIDECFLYGPLFMRPSHVRIKDTQFKKKKNSVPVIFEESSITQDNTPGVIFENNVILNLKGDEPGVISKVRNSYFYGNNSKMNFGKCYQLSGNNIKAFNNK